MSHYSIIEHLTILIFSQYVWIFINRQINCISCAHSSIKMLIHDKTNYDVDKFVQHFFLVAILWFLVSLLFHEILRTRTMFIVYSRRMETMKWKYSYSWFILRVCAFAIWKMIFFFFRFFLRFIPFLVIWKWIKTKKKNKNQF